MTINYNLNIPLATNSPSVDQPPMKVNTNAIQTILGVDHYNFNVASATPGGMHQQVTFPANNVPAVPTTPPVLFTNVQDGAGNALPNSIAELFYYSGSGAQGRDNYVSKSKGSVLLFGGIIVKWGTSSRIGTGGANDVIFVNAFPNNNFVVLLTGTNTSYTGTLIVTTPTLTKFNTIRGDGGSGSTSYNYIAIGN